jgi:hypothetical protein
MSRISKFLAVTIVVVFLLACNFVTQPLRDTQNLAETAQAIGSSIPMETLQALPSAFPAGTFEAFATSMPDIGNILDPQGTPVQEWKGIPIMPQATAGQEFPESNIYSFKANVTSQEVQDFYDEKLAALGWTQPFAIPNESGEMSMILFQKGSNALTIMVLSSEGSVVVTLTLV